MRENEFYRYEMKMRQTEDRMRALGLMPPTSFLTLDEWEIPRDRVVINRKLGEGAFGTVFGGEAFFDEKGWVSSWKKAFTYVFFVSFVDDSSFNMTSPIFENIPV